VTDREHPAILAAATALPKHYADQEAIVAALRKAWGRAHYNVERLEELHQAVQVNGRYLALPLDAYPDLVTFEQRNSAWIATALDIGEQAIRQALVASQLEPQDVDHLLAVTTTGIATPSLDALLINRLGLRADVKRTPIFGLGCAGGAGGLARAADYLRGYPDQVAVLVSSEVCSLTLQREDLSIPNIIASGLFGDGAAAVVLAGAERTDRGDNRDRLGVSPLPRILASHAVFYPDTERVMGWDVVDSGLKVVLSARVPEVIRSHVGADVDRFLADAGLERGDVHHWLVHTGGPRVLEAFAEALDLPADALERSWRSLAEVGNLSSASVLFVLAEMFATAAGRPQDRGLLAAMGPGFGSELLLLGW
jgi:alkylresorcinol/alkylpyrone synthase